MTPTRARAILVFVILAAACYAVASLFWADTAEPPGPIQGPDAETKSPTAESSEDDGAAQATATPERTTPIATSWRRDRRFQRGLSGVKGRVVDGEDRPVPRVRVRLRRNDWDTGLILQTDFAPLQVPEGHTDDEGRFEVRGAWPAGHMSVEFVDERKMLQLRRLRGPLQPGEVRDLGEIPWARGAELRGRVVDARGEPLDDVRVRAVFGSFVHDETVGRFEQGGIMASRQTVPARRSAPEYVRTTRTEFDGGFRFEGLPLGQWHLTVHEQDELELARWTGNVNESRVDAGELRAARRVLRGRILDALQEPVPGAEIAVSFPQPTPPSLQARLENDPAFAARWRNVRISRIGTPAGADGTFRLVGAFEDRVTLAARRPGHAWTTFYALPIDEEHELRLTEGHALTITVLDELGNPVEGVVPAMGPSVASVLPFLGAPQNATVPDLEFDMSKRATSTGPGVWVVPELPPGPYWVGAHAAHRAGFTTVRLPADTAAEVRLSPNRSFTVRVIGPNAKPLPNCVVTTTPQTIHTPGAWRCHGTTDGRGEVQAFGIMEETCFVRVRHPLLGDAEAVHTLDGTEREVELRLHGFGRLAARVTKDGAPLTHEDCPIILVRVDGSGHGGPGAFVDADGRFHSRQLPAGEYRLEIARVRADRERWHIRPTVQIFSGKLTEQDFELVPVEGEDPRGLATLEGTVIANGEPMNDVHVGVSTGHTTRVEAPVVDGKYRLDRVPTGTRIIYVWKKLGEGRHRSIGRQKRRLANGEIVRLDFDLKTATLTGRIEADMTDYSRFVITVEPKGTDRWSARFFAAAPDGTFRAENVPFGTYQIHARDNDAALLSEKRELTIDRVDPPPVEFSIERLPEVNWRLPDEIVNQFTGSRIFAFYRGPSNGMMVFDHAKQQFHARNLRPGSYKVEVVCSPPRATFDSVGPVVVLGNVTNDVTLELKRR